jgi:cardiolipin synthase
MLSNEFKLNNCIELIKSGKQFFDLLNNNILASTKLIQIHSYIFNDDNTGKKIINSLILAARKKIEVQIIIDGIASSISQKSIKLMRKEGINLFLFEPLFSGQSIYLGRRMHQKIAVFDNQKALVGGINIADRYNDNEHQKAWLDYAIYIEGDAVEDISEYCKSWWLKQDKKNEDDQLFPKKIFGESKVRIRRNDWIKHLNEISNTYLEIFRTAKKEIIVLCSYFLPGKAMRRYLSNATKRGVKVVVILAKKSDVTISKEAERWLYDWLIRNGIRIFEYKNNILHGKLAICDGEWMTIGSYNINNLSTYVSIEFNVDIKDSNFCTLAKREMERLIEYHCDEIKETKQIGRNNVAIQMYRWICYFSLVAILKLSTFYFKRSKGYPNTTLP